MSELTDTLRELHVGHRFTVICNDPKSQNCLICDRFNRAIEQAATLEAELTRCRERERQLRELASQPYTVRIKADAVLAILDGEPQP